MLKMHSLFSFVIFIYYISFGVAFATSPITAPTKESVQKFVTNLSGQVIEALKNNEGNLQGRQKSFEEIFRASGDVPRIARFVAAPAWRGADTATQNDYVETYHQYMAYTYATRITKYQNQQLKIQRISDVTQKNILINTILFAKSNPSNRLSIIWQLQNRDQNLKVTDLKIENISMALTQRAEFTAFLRKNQNDLKILTEFLKKRLNSDQ